MPIIPQDDKSSTPSAQVRIVAEYSTAYNAITRPNSYVAMSHYFAARWAAEIGGTGVLLILQLRALGFYNPSTGEKREEIPIKLPELAKRCKASVSTLKRELANNKALQQFVKVQSQYRRDKSGAVYRTENVYHIRMDDPLHPDDVPALQEQLDAADKNAAHDGKAQFERRMKAKRLGFTTDEPDAVQFEPIPVQKRIATVQNEPDAVQNELTLNHYSYPKSITKNTKTSPLPPKHGGTPPAAARALSEVKTTFSFEERKEPKPTPMPYDMAGEKREQFQAMAAAEIGKALEGTGLKANYRAIDSRGRTLYEQACREAAAKEGN